MALKDLYFSFCYNTALQFLWGTMEKAEIWKKWSEDDVNYLDSILSRLEARAPGSIYLAYITS